jgi:hypothetical protein
VWLNLSLPSSARWGMTRSRNGSALTVGLLVSATGRVQSMTAAAR